MDDEVFDLNLSSLEEFVIDEEKIVTYEYLSKKLCIHVNQSKVLLKTFLQRIRSRKSNDILNVKYIISGLNSDNKAIVRVMDEEDLQNFRTSMKHIEFEHIYSVSKGTTVDDIALAATKDFDDFSMAIGLIKNNLCSKHSLKEINALKQNSQNLDKIDIIKRRQENLTKVCKDEKEVINTVTSTCSSPTKRKISNENSSNELISKKQKFAKAVTKNQKGITGFFSKQKESTKDSNTFNALNTPIKKEFLNDSIKTVHHNHIANSSADNSSNEKESLLPSENVEGKKNTKTETKSLSSIVKNAKVEKKRKRVLKVSDSESEEDSYGAEKIVKVKEEKIVKVVKEEQDRVDSDNEIPPTPTTHIITLTSRKANPRKIKKIVDKTYTDEEGYILTKKEEVYETDSDTENGKKEDEINDKKVQQSVKENSPEAKEVHKTISKKSKKKVTSPQKGKQVTMMKFFKRIP